MYQFIQWDDNGHLKLTANLLHNLRYLVKTTEVVSREDQEHLAQERCGGLVGKKIREYLYLDKLESLELDEKEILGALVYQTKIDKEAPVFVNSQIQPSSNLEDPIYTRSWIPGLLTMHWKNECTERKDCNQTRIFALS